jgi:glutamine amidotransferase
MSYKIAIVDFGMGNIHTLYRKIISLKATPLVVSNICDLSKADKIILPGVGHFGRAMEQMRKHNLIDGLNEEVLIKKKEILGICLGMQLMANRSEEGGVTGLGWIGGDVIKFRIKNKINFKVPHIGWNSLTTLKSSKLTQNISEIEEFYFVHSFHYILADSSNALCITDYENVFVSAIERENIFGVQFHPEKSHHSGLSILKNFIFV